ncbi:MAG: hypothetical protein UZ16_OP3001002182, partial [Candidatus Hinthialibacteria bacterium OLB16]
MSIFWVLVVAISLSWAEKAACQEAVQAEAIPDDSGASSAEDVRAEMPDFLLETDEFSGDEGVWSDEFDDNKPSTAWFVYNIDYFTNMENPLQQDPRLPNESGQTIYDDPIRAREQEGLLAFSGSRSTGSGGAESTAKYDATDLKRYKVISPDVIRGDFQAELKIALRGKTFREGQVLFAVREHDWKFGGVREAHVRTTIQFPSDNPTAPAEIVYEGNWNQEQHSSASDKLTNIRAESSITITLRRSGGDNQIQYWTSEDEGEPELRGRLRPLIDTDMVDLLVAIQVDPIPNQEGILTLDSLTIRGPQIPDVEEGSDDQNLRDYRTGIQTEYETDIKGRFDYTPAALAANRGFTWMHLYGTGTVYPPGLLPLPQADANQQLQQSPMGIPPLGGPGFPGAPAGYPGGGFPGAMPGMGEESGGLAQPMGFDETGAGGGAGVVGMPIIPVEAGSDQEKALHNALDTQSLPRGDRRYMDEALKKYREARNLDPKYETIYNQIQWVRNVAYDRILRILEIFRARTADSSQTGTEIPVGNRMVKKDLSSIVGTESGLSGAGGELGGLGGFAGGGGFPGGGGMPGGGFGLGAAPSVGGFSGGFPEGAGGAIGSTPGGIQSTFDPRIRIL